MSTDHLEDTSIWNRSALANVTVAPISGPYSGAPATGLVPTTTNTTHGAVTNNFTVAPGSLYTASLMVKQGVGSGAEFSVTSALSGASVKITLDFPSGVSSLTRNNAFLSNGGLVESWGAVPIGSGWYRLWITSYQDTTSNIANVRINATSNTGAVSFAGDGSSSYLYTAGAQYESGHWPTSYTNISQPLGAPVYRNTIAEIVRYIVTTYGDATQKLVYSDLNITTFTTFDATHRQAVGLYLDQRANVVDVSTQLFSSVGARLIIDSGGLAAPVQLSLPQSTTGTQVGPADMVEHSLHLVQVAPVVAGVTIGYCQNYTVQTTLAGGLAVSSVALFQNQWLSVNRTDSAAAANYNLFTVPAETDTLLMVGYDAATEANRRLNIFNTQRKLLQYQGYYSLLFENLGAPQTITNPRFGCTAGVTGQILSIAVDFTSPHITFQVLI